MASAESGINRVGFTGLGSHGCPMALNLVRAGFEVMVWDSRPEAVRALEQAGAKVVASLEEVGGFGDFIGVCEVADPDWDEADVEEVAAGLIAGARPGAILAFHAAIYPSTVRRIAERAETRSMHVVDAQVNGGEGRARSATLSFMLGGDRQLLERCQPVFDACGSSATYMGPLGAGAAAKVAHYLLVCANLVTVAEVMRLVESEGVDLPGFQTLVHESLGQSEVSDQWLKAFRPMPNDRAEHLYRRGGYALGMAAELGLSLPAAGLVHQLMRTL